ncbi:MAG: hypothetical protein ACI83H_002910, partial [Glaciecola sp.]
NAPLVLASRYDVENAASCRIKEEQVKEICRPEALFNGT